MVNEYVSERPSLRRRERGESREGLTAKPQRAQRPEEIFGVSWCDIPRRSKCEIARANDPSVSTTQPAKPRKTQPLFL